MPAAKTAKSSPGHFSLPLGKVGVQSRRNGQAHGEADKHAKGEESGLRENAEERAHAHRDPATQGGPGSPPRSGTSRPGRALPEGRGLLALRSPPFARRAYWFPASRSLGIAGRPYPAHEDASFSPLGCPQGLSDRHPRSRILEANRVTQQRGARIREVQGNIPAAIGPSSFRDPPTP